MEENKNCMHCDEKSKNGHCCDHKCCGRVLKIVVVIIILIVVFCLGSLYGKNKSLRYGYQGFMMKGFYGPKGNLNNSATDSATVKVLPENTTSPVKE